MSSYNLGTASGKIVVDGSAAEKGFNVAGQAAGVFGDVVQEQIDKINRIGTALVAAGATGTAAIAVVTNSAANFEQRLSAVQAVSGATAEEMDKLSEAALRIGADTSFSATEAASAIEELVKAGLSIPDVMNGAADATVALAEAGEIALPQAAEIAASAMNNFNLTGEQMPRVADMIAGAANASAISVGEFGSSLTQVGAVANLTGMSFDDVAVAVAEMGNAGIKGSDAGTSLKTMLMNLIPVTDKQIGKFEELGLLTTDLTKVTKTLTDAGFKPAGDSMEDAREAASRYLAATQGIPDNTALMSGAVDDWLQKNNAQQNAFFDTEGKVKSLAEIQEILRSTTANMTEEQKLMNLEVLFGADAIRAAAVMAKEGAAGYDTMYAAMGNVTAAEVAKTRMDNLKGAQEELSGAIETFGIKIGQYFLEPAKNMVRALTNIISKITEAPDWVFQLMASFLGLGTALATGTGLLIKFLPAMLGLGKVMLVKAAMNAAKTAAMAFYTQIAAGNGIMAAASAMKVVVAGHLTKLIALFRTGTTAARGLAAAVTFLSGPWGWVIAAVLALIAAFVLLYKNNEGFRNWVDGIVSAIRDWLQPVLDGAKAAFETFMSVMRGDGGSGAPKWLEPMIPIFQAIRDAGLELANIWNTKVWPALQSAGELIQSSLGKAWQELSAVWESSLKPALTELGRVITEEVWPAIQTLAAALWPVIQVIGKVVGVIIGGLLFALFEVVKFIIGKVWPVLIKIYSWLAANLITVLAKVATWIIQYLVTPLVTVISFIVSKVGPVFQWIANIISIAFNWVIDVIGNVIDWFKNLVAGAEGAKEGAGSAFQGVIDWFKNLWANIVAIGAQIWTAITTPFVTAWNFLIAIMTSIFTAITAPMTAVWNFISPVLMSIYNVITATFGLIFTVVSEIVQIGWLLIQGTFKVAYEFISMIITTMWTTITEVWTAIWTTSVAIFQGIWDFIVMVWNSMLETVSAVASAVWAVVTSVWDSISATTSAVWNAIWGVISAVWNSISSTVSSVINTVKGVISSVWNTISSTTSSIWNTIYSYIEGPINRVKGIIQSVTDAIKTIWTNAWNSIRDKIGEFLEPIVTKTQAIIDAVKNAFTSAPSMLLNAGKDIVQGLINGLSSKITALKNKAQEVANSIKDNIKGFFGIASPSKLMIKYGGWIGEGLEMGLADSIRGIGVVVDNISSTIDNNIIPQDITIPSPVVGPTNFSAGDNVMELNGPVELREEDLRHLALLVAQALWPAARAADIVDDWSNMGTTRSRMGVGSSRSGV